MGRRTARIWPVRDKMSTNTMSRGSLRPNYSYNSLAAAEQLEALMHAPPTPTADALARQQQQQPMNGGTHPSSMYGNFSRDLTQDALSLPRTQEALSLPRTASLDADGSGATFNPAELDRMDLWSMQLGGLLMSRNNSFGPVSSATQQPQAAACSAAGAYPGGPRSSEADLSALSMLRYAGAVRSNAMGVYDHLNEHLGAGGLSNIPLQSCHQNGHSQQQNDLGRHSPPQPDPGPEHNKRRFVWTPELHQRFEAAVNALGLDVAKPKNILKLMNVDGLTKVNIKSHLQKYRCLMAKRASEAAQRANESVSRRVAGPGGALLSPSPPLAIGNGSINGSDSRSTATLDAESGSLGGLDRKSVV